MNAPNDGAAHPDGWLFFTDPGYGGLMNYEGKRLNTGTPQPIQKEAIYRIDAPGKVEKVADEPFKPNGLCFSPDFKKVYVADTGVSHYPNAKSVIWVYDVDGKKLKNPKMFASMEMNGKTGFADGIRCDEDGNVWAGMGWVGDGYDGVHVFSPDGTRIGQIRMPEIISNIVLRRHQAQPPVHDRQHVAVRRVRRNSRGQYRRLVFGFRLTKPAR